MQEPTQAPPSITGQAPVSLATARFTTFLSQIESKLTRDLHRAHSTNNIDTWIKDHRPEEVDLRQTYLTTARWIKDQPKIKNDLLAFCNEFDFLLNYLTPYSDIRLQKKDLGIITDFSKSMKRTAKQLKERTIAQPSLHESFVRLEFGLNTLYARAFVVENDVAGKKADLHDKPKEKEWRKTNKIMFYAGLTGHSRKYVCWI